MLNVARRRTVLTTAAWALPTVAIAAAAPAFASSGGTGTVVITQGPAPVAGQARPTVRSVVTAHNRGDAAVNVTIILGTRGTTGAAFVSLESALDWQTVSRPSVTQLTATIPPGGSLAFTAHFQSDSYATPQAYAEFAMTVDGGPATLFTVPVHSPVTASAVVVTDPVAGTNGARVAITHTWPTPISVTVGADLGVGAASDVTLDHISTDAAAWGDWNQRAQTGKALAAMPPDVTHFVEFDFTHPSWATLPLPTSGPGTRSVTLVLSLDGVQNTTWRLDLPAPTGAVLTPER